MITLLTIVFAVCETLGAVQPRANADNKQMAQHKFQEALSLRQALPLEDYLDRLQEVTRLDGKFAEAFHELGRAYIEQGTIDGRTRALAALGRAIQLAPQNTEFRYTLATLYIKRGSDGDARSELRKIMKIDPADPRPYYHLALFKEEDMLHYREMVSLHEDAVIHFYPFAEKDFVEAERLLRSALGLDPKMAEAYHHLSGLYFEAQRYDKMAELLDRAVKQVAAVDIFLFLGLARQQLGQPDSALQVYQRALQMMPPADRAFFHSLQPVLAPDSLSFYENAPDSLKTQLQQRYWKGRDPLFLTEANERLLEHFGRIAYANLRYSVPEKNLAGWKTDRGQTLIRFGQPQQRVRTRADLGTSPSGHITLNASREFWDYGDFQMIFDDRFLNRNYSFAWGSVGEIDGKWLFEQKIREAPERYVYPHGGRRLDLPHVIAQFRSPADSVDASSTRLEIYFGIPDSSLQAMPGKASLLALRRGLFFFDDAWNEIRQWREDRQLSHLAGSDPASAPDSPAHLLDRWTVRMPPGAYHLSLEVMEKNSGRSGAARETITVEDFTGASLQMSDVVLASASTRISGTENSGLALYQKDGVHLVPCLSYRFGADTPIYVYYEVYNLTLAANGQSRYRIDYVAESQQEAKSLVSRAFDRIGKLLGKGARPVAITSSFESAGDQRLEKLYHSIAILGHPAGPYDLTIRLIDQISGQSAERRVTFEIVK